MGPTILVREWRSLGGFGRAEIALGLNLPKLFQPPDAGPKARNFQGLQGSKITKNTGVSKNPKIFF